MAKRVIAWILLIVLTAGIAISGTLAYLTDRDSEANVFTTGDVNISLKEDFDQGSTLIPGADINKDVQIRNAGPNAAWVWYTYAIPQALDGNLDLIYSNEVRVESLDEIQEVLAPGYPDSDIKIVLTEDLIIDKDSPWGYTDSNGAHFQIYKNKKVTFDLNGHKIIVKEDALKEGKTHANALFLVRNASLNLIGPGEIQINNKAIAVYCWQDQYQEHSVKIFGDVKITSNSHERANASPESIIYAQHADNDANTGKEKHLECYVYGGILDGYALNIADKCSKHEAQTLMVLYEGVRIRNIRIDLLRNDIAAGRIKLEEGCTLEQDPSNPEWYYIAGPRDQAKFEGADNHYWLNGRLVGTTVQNGVTYNVYSRLYREILPAGETTPIDLSGVKLADYVDITPDGQLYKVVNGETVQIDWNLNQNNGDTPYIFISAYAIQTEGIADVNAAFAAYNAQWGDQGSEYETNKKLISNQNEMRDANKLPDFKAVLSEDVVVDDDKGTGYCFYVKYDGTVDLNGCDINVELDNKNFNGVFYVLNGATLNIVGDGNININGGVGQFIWCTGANGDTTVNIYGGNWRNTSDDFNADNYCEGIYANREGKINIYGGFFEWSSAFNNVTVNESREGVITIYGGTFVNFDPSVSWDSDGSYVAEGYTVVSETQANGDIWYTVVKA